MRGKIVFCTLLTMISCLQEWVTGDHGLLIAMAERAYDGSYLMLYAALQFLLPLLFGVCLLAGITAKPEKRKTAAAADLMFFALQIAIVVTLFVTAGRPAIYSLILAGVFLLSLAGNLRVVKEGK